MIYVVVACLGAACFGVGLFFGIIIGASREER